LSIANHTIQWATPIALIFLRLQRSLGNKRNLMTLAYWDEILHTKNMV